MALTLDKFKIDPKKATEKDLQEALELLAKNRLTKERIKTGELKGSTGVKVADMTPEQKKKYQAYNTRLTVKNRLMMEKAKKANITVTEAEIDAYLKLK
jgi:hypothetical protein